MGHNKRLYWIWQGMKRRCYNSNCNCFKWYGSKGITVCDEWKNDFSKFKEWALSSGYTDLLTIDRIDSNKNYEPSNCQWITQSENSKKMQKEHKGKIIIEFNGETHKLSVWARKLEINQSTLLYRLRRGWSVERALTERVR
jgi:hypothetical protein